ncbi:glycosyltransferase family 2 protein [Microbacterium sp. Mu-80]|uniref:Glycosyltransferase family 2 protein n=1 Tax=Microbacterium bandirmense TaxID=3122050 RepID=A0ABU8L9V5_9MICO
MPDTDPTTPAGVSFVMPVLNERDYLEHAVRSVLEQDVDGPTELVLALGPSTDGTTELAHRLAEEDGRVHLVQNPAAHIPVGLNAAIRASRYPTVIRVDAHSELSPGYARRALETLERTGAANVGGVMRADGRTPFQRAVARLYNSPVGLGGGAYHGSDREGEAESAYLGVMRREVLDRVGLFDESIRRGEDWELNLRIREAGHLVWFDPQLSVTYWPRESWWRLARQFRATGAWRGELVRRFGRSNGLRFFAPPALVLVLALALVVGVLQLTGVLHGVLSIVASAVYLPLIAYAALVVAVALSGRRTLRDRLWTMAVLPTMHVSWGLGFLTGVLRGAGDTVDASRLGNRNTPLP